MAKISEILGVETDYDDRVFKRGEIYFVDLNGINEITRHISHKSRPALIISNDKGNTYGPTLIVALLTTSPKREYPFQYHLNINGKESIIMFEQILTIDKNRVLEKYHELTQRQMKEAEKKLCYSLGLNRISFDNLVGINVLSLISKKTLNYKNTYFEIGLNFLNEPSLIVNVPLQDLQELLPEVTADTPFGDLEKLLDNSRGISWLMKYVD